MATLKHPKSNFLLTLLERNLRYIVKNSVFRLVWVEGNPCWPTAPKIQIVIIALNKKLRYIVKNAVLSFVEISEIRVWVFLRRNQNPKVKY